MSSYTSTSAISSSFFSSAELFIPMCTGETTVYRYLTKQERVLNDQFPYACFCGKSRCECGLGAARPIFQHIPRVKPVCKTWVEQFSHPNCYAHLDLEPLNEVTDNHWAEYVYNVYTNSDNAIKVPSKPKTRTDLNFNDETIYCEPDTFYDFRSVMLLFKIRKLIRDLRNIRTGNILLNSILYNNPELIDPKRPKRFAVETAPIPIPIHYAQSDVPSVTTELGGLEINKQNVTLVDSRLPVTTSFEAPGVSWVPYINSDITTNVNEMTEKWLLIDEFTWKSTDAKNTEIFAQNYPIDIFSKLNVCDFPVLQPFATHQFAVGDMKIKIVLNSNQFSLGTLCVSWLYETEKDNDIMRRRNVYCQLQNHHALINSSVSNSVVLDIPYKHSTPSIHTGGRKDLGNPLDLGQLLIYVLNPLTVATGGIDTLQGNIFISLENWKFYGQKHASVAPVPRPTPKTHNVQMMPLVGAAAVGAVEGVLNHIAPSANQDLPPVQQNPPLVTITPSNNWSTGRNDFRTVFPMRLDALGQTPHPRGCDSSDNNSAKSIARRWGYVTTVEWNRLNEKNTTLIQIESHPTMHSSILPKWSDQPINQYVYPPVSVISSMYSATRCTLEWKIVAAHCVGKQTGRIMIGFVPGATAATKVDTTILRAGHHMVWDLQEQTEIVYTSPYVNNKAWAKRKYGPNNVDLGREPIGYLYIVVLSKLVPMQSVPEKCFLNIFLRAGPDFECAIPVQPCFSPAWSTELILSAQDQCWAVPGYAPYYWGHWSGLGDIETSRYKICARFGQFGGNVSIFTEHNKLSATHYGYFVPKDVSQDTGSYKDETGKLIPVQYMVLLQPSGETYLVALACKSAEDAAKAATLHWKNGQWLTAVAFGIDCKDTTDNIYCVGNPVWDFKLVTTGNSINHRVQNEDTIIVPTKKLASLRNGLVSFGEDFSDLKDYARRAFYYATIRLSRTSVPYPIMQVSFPIMPQGLELVLDKDAVKVNQILNRLRYNPIALISSAFRYYRGGMRLKIVGSSASGIMIVQIRPDYGLTHDTVKYLKFADNGDALLNHGYALHCQSLAIAPQFEIEVPFYNLGSYNLLQRPHLAQGRSDVGDYTSLGECFIGGVGMNSGDYQIFVSLADDFAFSTWQGFPPMCVLDEIDNNPPAFNEHDASKTLIPRQYKAQMMSWVSGIAKDSIKTAVKDKVQEVTEDFKKKWAENNPFNDTKDSTFSNKVLSIFAALGNLIINFNLKTMIFTVVVILGFLGIATINFMDKIKKLCTDLYTLYFTDKMPGYEEIEMKPRSHTAQSSAIIAGIISLIVAFFGALGIIFPSNYPRDSWASKLTFGLGTVARSATNIHTFISNMIGLIKDMLQWVCVNNSFTGWLFDKFETTQHTFIDRWITESQFLLRESSRDAILIHRHSELVSRLHFACDIGRLIMSKLPVVENNGIYNRINNIHKDLLKLMREAGVKGVHALTRIEPYFLCISGENGIGKSKTHVDLITHIAKENSITAPNNKLSAMIDTTQKWWNDVQCTEQFVLIDDMWNVRDEECIASTLRAFTLLSGDVPCSVPKADVDSKENYFSPVMVNIYTNHPFYLPENVDKEYLHPRIHDYWNAELVNSKFDICCSTCKLPFITRENCPHCISGTPPRKWATQDRKHLKLLSDFHHLSFSKYEGHSTDSLGLDKICYACFKKAVNSDFQVFNMQAIQSFEENLERFNIAAESYIDDSHWTSYETLEDWIEGYYKQMENSYSNKLSRVPNYLSRKSKQAFNYLVPIGDDHVLDMSVDRQFDYKRAVIKRKIINFINKAKNYFKKHHDSQALLNMQSTVHFDWNYFSNNFPIMPECERPQNRQVDLTDIHIYHPKTVIPKEYVRSYNFPANVRERCTKDFLDLIDYTTPEDDITLIFIPLLTHAFHGFANDKLGFKNFVSIMHRSRSAKGEYLDTETCLLHPNTGRCLHMNKKFLESVVVEKDWYMGTYKLGKCSHAQCPLKIPVLKYLIYSVWLVQDISRVRALNKGHRVIPDDFVTVENGSKLYFHALLIELKRIWVNNLGPVLGNIWKWIKKYAVPCVLLTMLGTYMSGVLDYSNRALDHQIEIQHQQVELMDTHNLSVEWKKVQGAYSAPVPSHKLPSLHQNVTFHAVQDLTPCKMTPTNDDAFIKKIKDNYITFVIEDPHTNQKIFLHGVGIKSNMVLVPKHYIDHILSLPSHVNIGFHYTYDINLIKTNGKCMPINIKNLEILNIHLDGVISNHALILLPSTFNSFKDITKLFKPLAEHNFQRHNGNVMCHRSQYPNSIIINKDSRGTIVKDGSQELFVKNIYTYNMQYPGMCGSLIYISGEKPIIGMHIAGDNSSNEGVSEMLYYEMFNSLPVDRVVENDAIITPINNLQLEDLVVTGAVTPLYKVDKHLAQYQPTDTNFVKSGIHGVFPVTTGPSVLRRNDPRSNNKLDPLIVGASKHGLKPLEFPYATTNAITNHITNQLINKMPITDVRVYSLNEAILGIPGKEMYDPLVLKTSAGFPLSSYKPSNAKGKYWLFNINKEHTKVTNIHPKLEAEMQTLTYCYSKGIRPVVIFTDCLKDEIMSLEKIKKGGKTRVFSIAPVQFTILFRQYFFDFLALFKLNRLSLPHAIGINTDSIQWTALYNKLITNNHTKIIAGDYSNFGPAFNSDLAQGAIECILRWYDKYDSNPQNALIRSMLLKELIGSKHLCNNYVYSVNCGCPSGSPITDILNSMVNWFYIYHAWLQLTSLPLYLFDAYCYMCVYGDDILISVNDSLVDKFNTQTISDYFKLFGVVFTDFDKSDKIVPYREIGDVEFLKRKFVSHPSRPQTYLAQISTSSIYSASNWVRAKHDNSDATRVNALASSLLAYSHGPIFYNEIVTKLRVKLCKSKIPPVNFIDWVTLDNRVFDGGFNISLEISNNLINLC
nr:MAG: polyprotein [Wufeng shrew iflavirus 10]